MSLSGRTDRQRKSGHQTESRQTESGQTDRQTPDRKSGQQTDTGQDFPEIPDKNETRTGYGQDTDSAVRRRLSLTTPVNSFKS